jgi:thioredoxin 1
MEIIKRRNSKVILSFKVLLLTLIVTACDQKSNVADKTKNAQEPSTINQITDNKHKVTFIELGSVRCIPCRQMQSVMKSIEAKYGKEVKIDFYDVWTDAGKPYGVKYGIEAIPTQIFLDETGKEYYRHEGYFPEEELVKVLQQKGVKPI